MSSPLNPCHWHILGAGSMGTLAAWRLQQAGHRTFLAGGDASERSLIFSDDQQLALTLDADPDEPIQALVVAVKAGDTVSAVTPLLPRLAPGAVLIRLQNGMGTLDDVALPDNTRVVHVVTTDGAWRDGKHIHVVAQNQSWAGDGQAQMPTALSGVDGAWQGWQWCTDITLRQWQKLAINAIINPLTALFDCRNGALLDQGPRQQAMAALAQELDHLIPHWLPQWPGNSLALAEQVAAQTANNISSMLADARAGRITEVDYINGYVARQAHAHQLDAPENQAICTRISTLHD